MDIISREKYSTAIKGIHQTNPLGLTKRCLLGEGLIVPVDEADEAEEAEEESSSDGLASGSGWSSSLCSSSRSAVIISSGIGGSKGRLASFAFAKALCRSLIIKDV
jgi:hypothetical protein